MDSSQTNQYYYEKISQLFADLQRHFLALKDDYQKSLKIFAKDNKLNNHASQKINEVFLFSTDPKNQENNNLFHSLESVSKENKELKKVYNYLFSLLESKTESGEMPSFIQVSFMALQNQLNHHDGNSDMYTNPIEKQSDLSPKKKENLPFLQQFVSGFSLSSSTPTSPQRQKTHKINFNNTGIQNLKKFLGNNSGPPSPNRDIINSKNTKNTKKTIFTINNNNKNDNSNINDAPINIESDDSNNNKSEYQPLKFEKNKATSMADFNISKANSLNHSKLNNLSKRTKSDFLNRAKSISFHVSRLNDISNLSNQVSVCQRKIEKLDNKIETMKSICQKEIEKRRIKSSRLSFVKNVQSFNLSEYADKEINCEQIPNISEMKQMITKNAGEASQQLLAIQQLQDLQNYLNQQKIELKVILLSNDRKKSDFNTIITSLKAIDPLFYGDISNTDKYVTRLGKIKEENEERLRAIENRVNEMKKQNDQINDKCNDILFIIENYKKQRMRMMQIPKVNVKQLCSQLKSYRSFVNENNRQIAFLNIIYNHLDGKIMKLNERYSNQSFEKLGNEITLLKSKVADLKNKFDHLRAARENHSIVLTNTNELKFLHSKIHDLISQIDVAKMRMGGVISKVEKQTKLLVQQQIPLPNLPQSIISYQENAMKKKTSHS